MANSHDSTEPVAWAMPKGDGTFIDVITPAEHARDEGSYTVPLFAHPVAQQPQARPDFADEWTGYLKDGETPFERFLRERKDLDALTKLYQRALEENERLKAQQRQAEEATSAGLEASISILSQLVDEQRQLLAEVDAVFGVDAHGIVLEDGDSALIDRVRAHLAATSEAKQPQAEAIPQGYRVVPDWKGYALLGSGQYLINHAANYDPELGAELIITLATEKDREGGRKIGESRPNAEDSPPVQPEEMVIRIGFLNGDALFVLEDQLADVRKVLEAAGKAAPQQAEAVPPDVVRDAERLDWLLMQVSGKEFKRIGVEYSGNCQRSDVDAAIAQQKGGV